MTGHEWHTRLLEKKYKVIKGFEEVIIELTPTLR